MPVFKKLRDDIDHLGNVMCCPRSYLRPLVSESVEIFPEILNIWSREFVDADVLFRRLVDDAVVNIGQVKYVRQFIALIFQIPTQNIAENERPEIADVRKIPDGGPADVHADLVVVKRMKLFDSSSQCVEKLKHIFGAGSGIDRIPTNNSLNNTPTEPKLARLPLLILNVRKNADRLN